MVWFRTVAAVFMVFVFMLITVTLAVNLKIKPTIPLIVAVHSGIVGIGNLLRSWNQVCIGIHLLNFCVGHHGNTKVFRIGTTTLRQGRRCHPTLVSSVVGIVVVKIFEIDLRGSILVGWDLGDTGPGPELGADQGPISRAFKGHLELGWITDQFNADTSRIQITGISGQQRMALSSLLVGLSLEADMIGGIL